MVEILRIITLILDANLVPMYLYLAYITRESKFTSATYGLCAILWLVVAVCNFVRFFCVKR